mmetsp:Transcript_18227/g.26954  ORF Transcript_18227/g.26954 Transcript_18227/m.26954 type:complete len:370 (-) Transcript_18227:957-2066(-)
MILSKHRLMVVFTTLTTTKKRTNLKRMKRMMAWWKKRMFLQLRRRNSSTTEKKHRVHPKRKMNKISRWTRQLHLQLDQKKSFDRYDSHLDDGARKKLSQMLLDSSLFHHQSNNNEWSSGFESTNDAWRSGCSVDGEDINTVDLESLDDALNNHDEIFREPRAPPSLSQEVHLLGASFAASSVSSDHDTIFERVLYEENRSKQIGHVDVSPLKKVAETRESFLDRTSRREDNHSRRSTISSKEDEPKVVRAQDISRREDDHSRLLSSVGNGERGLKGRTQTYSRREDNHSRRSSLSSREKELEGRTRDNSRREDKHHSRLLSTRSKEEEPKVLKENTIIVMSVRGRKGKDKYARHARKQRLASKVTSLKP